MSSPMPVPLPGGLVVKKASKTRAWISDVMPGPLSCTSTTTQPSRAAVLRVICGVGVFSSASAALSSRLVHTWFSSLP